MSRIGLRVCVVVLAGLEPGHKNTSKRPQVMLVTYAPRREAKQKRFGLVSVSMSVTAASGDEFNAAVSENTDTGPTCCAFVGAPWMIVGDSAALSGPGFVGFDV